MLTKLTCEWMGEELSKWFVAVEQDYCGQTLKTTTLLNSLSELQPYLNSQELHVSLTPNPTTPTTAS